MYQWTKFYSKKKLINLKEIEFKNLIFISYIKIYKYYNRNIHICMYAFVSLWNYSRLYLNFLFSLHIYSTDYFIEDENFKFISYKKYIIFSDYYSSVSIFQAIAMRDRFSSFAISNHIKNESRPFKIVVQLFIQFIKCIYSQRDRKMHYYCVHIYRKNNIKII